MHQHSDSKQLDSARRRLQPTGRAQRGRERHLNRATSVADLRLHRLAIHRAHQESACPPCRPSSRPARITAPSPGRQAQLNTIRSTSLIVTARDPHISSHNSNLIPQVEDPQHRFAGEQNREYLMNITLLVCAESKNRRSASMSLTSTPSWRRTATDP